MLHRLCEPPSIPLSFSLAAVLPRRGTYRICFDSDDIGSPLPSAHRLQLGLPGYLILFAPLAFAPQRQMRSSDSPSPPVFLQISTHFTATPGVPITPPALKLDSIEGSSAVELQAFTPDLKSRLRALYAQ
jgi:hypothetical protein